MSEPTSPLPQPPTSTKAKIVRIGELAVDHVLALLETAEPGSLNAHQLKTILQLLRDASVSPIEADHQRELEEQAARRRAFSVPFTTGKPIPNPGDSYADFEMPDDSHHLREAEERRRRGEQ